MISSSTFKRKSPEYYMERSCRRPWEAYVPPIKMCPRVYYISGNDWVGCYLIETSEGLILIDTAMHETLYLMIENIRKLGYELTDIKKILISHAHIDHIGGARALKELTGAKIYLGKRDMLFLTERKELIANEDGRYTCGDFEPDEYYSDDKPIVLGDITINTVATPGHTPGCTSFFFDVPDNSEKVLHCGMHGGIGANTLSMEYFNKTNLPPTLRDEYIEGLKKLNKMYVDICLPSHANQAPVLELADQITEDYNPYNNPSTWHKLMEERLATILEIIEKENGNK